MPLIKPSQRQLDAAKMSGANLNGNIMYDTDQNALIDVSSTDENLRAGQNPGENTLPDEQKPGEKKGFLSTVWEDAANAGGMAKRAWTHNVLPVTAGGVVASRTHPIIGLGAGMATKMGQDYLLNKWSEAHPEGETAKTFRQYQADEAAHPWWSTALTAPLAGMAGGRFIPALTRAGMPSLKEAGKIAGLLTGVNTAAQVAQGGLSNVDLGAAAVGALTSLPFAKPGRFSTALERDIAQPTKEATFEAASRMSKNGNAVRQRRIWNEDQSDVAAEQPYVPIDDEANLARMPGRSNDEIHNTPDKSSVHNVDFLINAPAKELAKNTDPYYQELARVKNAVEPLGMRLTPEDVDRIATQVGSRGQIVGNEIITRLQQEARGMAPSSQPPVIDQTPAKSAPLSADAINQAKNAEAEVQSKILAANEGQVGLAKQAAAERQNAAGVKSAIEGLTPEPTGKSAEESATAIGSRPAEVKQLDVLAKNYKSKEAAAKRQLKLLSTLDEESPGYQDLLQDYMNLAEDIKRDKVNLLKAGGEKLLYGEQSPVPEGYSLPKPAPKEAPVPEETPVAPAPEPAPAAPAEKPAAPPTATPTDDLAAKLKAAQAAAGYTGEPKPPVIVAKKPTKNLTQDELNAALAESAKAQEALKVAAVAKETPVETKEGQPLKPAAAKPVKAATETTALAETPKKAAKKAAKPVMVKTADKAPKQLFTDAVPADTEVNWADGKVTKRSDGSWFFAGPDRQHPLPETVVKSKEFQDRVRNAASKPAAPKSETPTAKDLVEETKPASAVKAQQEILEAMAKENAAAEAKLTAAKNKAAAEEQAKKAAAVREKESKAQSRVGQVLKPSKPAAQETTALNEEKPNGLQVKPSKRGSQGGFLTLPFDQATIKAKYKEVESRLRPALEVIKKASETGKHIAGKWRDAYNMQRKLEYKWIDEAAATSKKYSDAEKANVGKYLNARHDGLALPTLTAKESQGVADYQRILDRITYEKMRPDSPWVFDYDPKTGLPTARPFRVRAGWAAVNEIRPEIREILNNSAKYGDKWKVEKQRYIDYLVNQRRIPLAQAKELFEAQYNVHSTENTNPNPEYASLRYQEGLGIPLEWRNPDVFNALQHYAHRAATDLAYHRSLESDPIYAKAVGLKDNGRGVATPTDVRLPSGKLVTHGELASDRIHNAVRRDYVGSMLPGAQGWEGFTHAVNALKFGPLTQVKDIIGSAPALAEVLQPHEIKYLNNGLKAMLFGGKSEAIKAGSVRGSRQLTPTLAEDLNSSMMKFGDMVSKLGGEQLAQAGRVFADGIGRAVARERLRTGDSKFFDQWGPSDWRNAKWNAKDIIDYVAQEVANNVGGAYNATELPAGLLRGQASVFKPLFMVQRWSIGRANRWIDHVFKPATQGNIKPLIMSLTGGMFSAAAVNALVQAVTGRKPKELTWSEYLKLGGKVGKLETAYTLLSKSNTAGYAGILGNLAYSAVQAASGERPTGFDNMLYQSVRDAGGIIEDALYAIGQGDVSPLDAIVTGTGEWIRRQSQIVRALTDRTKDETGNREERIAKRMGYQRNTQTSSEAPNPYSQNAALERGDVDTVAKMLKRKVETGQRPAAPQKAVRQTKVMREGKPVGYYDFIKDAQGEEASDAAKKRDIERTRKRYGTFREGLSTAFSR